MIIAAFLLAATPLILQGCVGAGGHEFTGQWQNVKDPADLVTIAKEGDQFIVILVRAVLFRFQVQDAAGRTHNHGCKHCDFRGLCDLFPPINVPRTSIFSRRFNAHTT